MRSAVDNDIAHATMTSTPAAAVLHYFLRHTRTADGEDDVEKEERGGSDERWLWPDTTGHAKLKFHPTTQKRSSRDLLRRSFSHSVFVFTLGRCFRERGIPRRSDAFFYSEIVDYIFLMIRNLLFRVRDILFNVKFPLRMYMHMRIYQRNRINRPFEPGEVNGVFDALDIRDISKLTHEIEGTSGNKQRSQPYTLTLCG